MSTAPPTPEQSTFDGSMNDLTAKVRAAHPGAYDDLNDADLTKKLLTKFPQYSDLAAPPVPKPPSLGAQINEEEGKARAAGLPGGSPNIQPATDTMAKVAGAGIGAAGLAVGVPAAARAAVAHPILTSIAISEARRIPYVGKYIPPYAEFAPLLMGGKGAAPEAAAEAEAPTSKEAMQKWWKERGGTLASERPNGPIRAARTKPSVPPEGGPAINIAPESGQAIPTGAPESPAIDTSPKRVGDLLNDSLGGKALKPDVPLRQQGQHIPVESSAMKSYKYDPAAKELEVASPSGAISIHGDVSPEQAEAFENATSKGKAWNELKKNSTFVGKIVNGKRVNVKPPKGMASASPDDLTGILQESLRQAQQ